MNPSPDPSSSMSKIPLLPHSLICVFCWIYEIDQCSLQSIHFINICQIRGRCKYSEGEDWSPTNTLDLYWNHHSGRCFHRHGSKISYWKLLMIAITIYCSWLIVIYAEEVHRFGDISERTVKRSSMVTQHQTTKRRHALKEAFYVCRHKNAWIKAQERS
jgi:hypothetical protein